MAFVNEWIKDIEDIRKYQIGRVMELTFNRYYEKEIDRLRLPDGSFREPNEFTGETYENYNSPHKWTIDRERERELSIIYTRKTMG